MVTQATPPTDQYEILQYYMIRAHETFKLGYDVILPLLDNPPTHDLKNFLGYCEAWADSIAGHHDAEEEAVFPVLQTKIDMSKEREQHEVIHTGLDDLLSYIRAAAADTTHFDGPTMKAKMTALRDPLYTHLDEEVEHLAPEHLKVFEAKTLMNIIAALEKHAKAHGNPFMVVPYMRSHTPPEYKDIWPPMPWILRKVLIPYVFAARYSGYWKYAPYPVA